MEASGATSAEEFELRHSKATGKIYMSRGLWSRYMRGETLPQSAASRRNRTLIERFDLEYPGTADIFFHPIWRLLDFKQLLGPEQLLAEYRLLEEDIWLQFVACIDRLKPGAPAVPVTFWPLDQSNAVRKMRLSKLSGLDGIAACLIESRLGHLSQVEDRFVTSMLIAGQHFKALRLHVPFQSLRMRSALLAMEGHCIGYVEGLTIATDACGPIHTELRSKARQWQEHWIGRCMDHMKQLSPSSLRVFRVWLKSSVSNNPTTQSGPRWKIVSRQ